MLFIFFLINIHVLFPFLILFGAFFFVYFSFVFFRAEMYPWRKHVLLTCQKLSIKWGVDTQSCSQVQAWTSPDKNSYEVRAPRTSNLNPRYVGRDAHKKGQTQGWKKKKILLYWFNALTYVCQKKFPVVGKSYGLRINNHIVHAQKKGKIHMHSVLWPYLLARHQRIFLPHVTKNFHCKSNMPMLPS